MKICNIMTITKNMKAKRLLQNFTDCSFCVFSYSSIQNQPSSSACLLQIGCTGSETNCMSSKNFALFVVVSKLKGVSSYKYKY